MDTRIRHITALFSVALLFATAAGAQVPVDEDGKPVGEYEPSVVAGEEDLAVLTAAELEELVGPIALYPDDLLAIVLPASTYPLQIVEAARFVENLKHDDSLKPDEGWDDSVVALTNYPEVLELMNEDLDWTWQLGEAVVAQQTDVIQAVEAFRDRAYAAGNLKSDEFQVITEEDGVIEISPAKEDVIYVPYYEPERVVVYQPRPVYYYYPRSYPVYYYPYPSGHYFDYGYFWGVTTAFRIGWHSHHLHTWHHSYFGHPYYGHSYYPRYWYRRPDIHVYNNYYRYDRYRYSRDRYRRGDYWQPRNRRTVRASDQRITRTRHYPARPSSTASRTSNREVNRDIRFRARSERDEPALRSTSQRRQAGTARTSQERRQPALRSSSQRRTSTARQPTQRQRQETRPQTERRTMLARAATPRRQSAPRQNVQRRESAQRPTVQRRQSAPRPTVQRRESAPRPTVQRRESAPRQATQRRQPQAQRSRPQKSASTSRSSRERSNSNSSRQRSSSGRSERRR